jgi:hypothetical protein
VIELDGMGWIVGWIYGIEGVDGWDMTGYLDGM